MRPLPMRSSRRLEFAVVTLAVLAALMVAAPVISLAITALQPAADVWAHLAAYVLPQAIADTSLLLIGVGALTLAIGAGTAWLTSSYTFPWRGALVWLLPLPLSVPTYLSAYVYVDLFEPLGLMHRLLGLAMPLNDALNLLPHLRSLPGAVVLLALVLYPYVYLSARTMFQAQSLDTIEAARMLGASRWSILSRVVLPMARPALAVGVALVALETLNDIGASEYLGVRTLTVSIFNTWLNRGSLAGAAQLSLLLLGLAAALMLVERIGRRNASVEFSAENARFKPRRPLRGSKAWLACAACLAPVLFGFIVPAGYLLGESLRRGLALRLDGTLWRDALHTLTLASIATMAALALGLVVVLATRWRGDRPAAFAASTVQLGYALPGLVLALGLLAPLLAVDGALAWLAHALGAASPGLLLIGSGGAGRLVTLWRIDLPLLKPALVGAAILVFVDCLKELPATLLLRPLNVDTLSTSIYQYASRGSFEEGALAALIIVAASIPPVIWLTRFADASQGAS